MLTRLVLLGVMLSLVRSQEGDLVMDMLVLPDETTTTTSAPSAADDIEPPAIPEETTVAETATSTITQEATTTVTQEATSTVTPEASSTVMQEAISTATQKIPATVTQEPSFTVTQEAISAVTHEATSTLQQEATSTETHAELATQLAETTTLVTLTSASSQSDSILSQPQTTIADSDAQQTATSKAVTDSIQSTATTAHKDSAEVDTNKTTTAVTSDINQSVIESTSALASLTTEPTLLESGSTTAESLASRTEAIRLESGATESSDVLGVTTLQDTGSLTTGSTTAESVTLTTDVISTSTASMEYETGAITQSAIAPTEPILLPEEVIQNDTITTESAEQTTPGSELSTGKETTTISDITQDSTGLEIKEIKVDDANITTTGIVEQINTTPVSASVSVDTDIMPKSEKNVSARIKVDPIIAVGIAPSIFEDATPLQKDKAATLEQTTESIEATLTTTPYTETTSKELLTTPLTTGEHITTESKTVKAVKETEPSVPEHPPPIIVIPSAGRQPEIPYFPEYKSTLDRQKPVGPTTQAPPPPIIIQRLPSVKPPRSQISLQSKRKPMVTTESNLFLHKHETKRTFIKPPRENDPRYMSVSELAQLALQQLARSQTHSKAPGLQVFFKPVVPTRRNSETLATSTPTENVPEYTVKVSEGNVPIEPTPWIRTQEIDHSLTLPGGTGVWGNKNLLGSWLQRSPTTERPKERLNNVQPFQPSPAVNRLSKTQPVRLPQNQLFAMPKGEASSNIWGSSDLLRHLQREATTTAKPVIDVRPIAQPPTVRSFHQTTPYREQQTILKQQTARREGHVVPLFNLPAPDSSGYREANTVDATVNIKPLVKTNTLFDMPGLSNLIQQKKRQKDDGQVVKPVWKAPVIESKQPKLGPEVKEPSPRTRHRGNKDVLQPLKNLRARQHDIRLYQTQPYHFYRPSINIAKDNELDLFLKSSLARPSGRMLHQRNPNRQVNKIKPVEDTKQIQYMRQREQPKPVEYTKRPQFTTNPVPTTPRPQTRKSYSIYRPEGRDTPLSFEELLLRQLRTDASLFNMQKWSVKQPSHTKPTTKPDSKANPSPDISSQPLAMPTTTPTTPVTRATTTSFKSTQEPVADEHPPPIFDSKVFKTFMPFPKNGATTKGPTKNETKNLMGTSDLRPFDEAAEHDHGSCKGCIFVNDRCLLPDPVHCNRYVECVRQGPAVRVFTRECALGSFFDRKSFLCVDPKNADCPQDRCREPGLKSYIIHGHCKHYWVCGSRKGGGIYAQAECCPEGGGFKEGEGCIENPNCTESCDFSKHTETIVGTKCECRQGIPVLSGDVCSCREPTALEKLKAEAKVCSPKLNMTFDDGRIKDLSMTRQHVGIDNVVASDKGELSMTAKGRVVLWRYSNLVFSEIFAVRLRFKSTKKGPRYQTLLSNCDPESGSEPSVEISVDTLYHEVIFSVNTYMSPLKQIKIYYQSNKWSTVYLIYDGERIVAAVDGRVRNIYSGGRIETRPNPIGIGSCGNKAGFHGLIDDIAFFEDCIADDMYDIFLNVLE